MFRGLGAGDALECWFPILPIIRLDVFFGPKAIYQEPLKVLSEANKGSTVKEPVWGLQWTWETTDVLNVAGNLPPLPPNTHAHTTSKKAGCVRSDGEVFLYWFSQEPHIVKDDLSSIHFQGALQRKGCKVVAAHLLVSPSVNWCECQATLSTVVSCVLHFKDRSVILLAWIRCQHHPRRGKILLLHCSCYSQHTQTLYWWLDISVVVFRGKAGPDKQNSTAMIVQNIKIEACIFIIYL